MNEQNAGIGQLGVMMDAPFDPSMFDTASGRRLKKVCGPCEPGAELTLIPEFMYFGYIEPGASSDWQPFIVKNTGIVNVGVEALELTGEFEIDLNAPVLLVPGESFAYSIRFSPTGNGVRGGDIIVKAATAGEQPVVKMIGMGGQVGAGGAGGAGVAWAYRYGTFALNDIAANEIILDYHVTTTHRLQSNFAGCKVSMGTPPASAFVLHVLKNDIEVGTITLNPNGTIVMATPLGASVQVPLNSIMTLRGPAIVDPALARLRVVFVGVI